MFCTKCGKEISETDAFCPACGTPTPAASEGAPLPEANDNPFAANSTSSVNPENPFAEKTTAAPTNEFANPFAANTTSTVDPSNPFAATTVEAPEKKKNKPIVLVAAIVAAVLVLSGLGYAYQAILIPQRDRETVLEYTDSCMDAICMGDTEAENSLLGGSMGFNLTDEDIAEVEDELRVAFEQELGVPAGDEVRASIDSMLRALLDRMVEGYVVDEDSYTRDGDTMTVDVNVTGIDVVALQNSLGEEDMEDMLYD